MNQAGGNLESALPVSTIFVALGWHWGTLFTNGWYCVCTCMQQYTGTINALINIPRNEGIMALYKGFLPLFYRKVSV
jgi:hypothetical protein